MLMNNMDVRKSIEKKRLRYFEVAAALKINPCTLSRWLQHELPPERKAKILEAIKNYEL